MLIIISRLAVFVDLCVYSKWYACNNVIVRAWESDDNVGGLISFEIPFSTGLLFSWVVESMAMLVIISFGICL